MNVIETLEGVTGASGLQRYVDLTRKKLFDARDNIRKSPFAALLPKDFSEVDSAVANGNSLGIASAAPFCMMSGFDSVLIQYIRGVTPRKGVMGNGPTRITRDTRTIEHIDYAVTKYVAFGGRSLYNVDVPDQSKWKSDAFSKVVLNYSVVESSDPASRIAGCVEEPDVQHGSPATFNPFIALLESYAALTAMEGRFLALQQSALDDLKSVKKIDATLRRA